MTDAIKPALSAEQAARDMLGRMGVEDAQSFTAGDVVELANLIAARNGFTREDVNVCRNAAIMFSGVSPEMAPVFERLGEKIAKLLPPDEVKG